MLNHEALAEQEDFACDLTAHACNDPRIALGSLDHLPLRLIECIGRVKHAMLLQRFYQRAKSCATCFLLGRAEQFLGDLVEAEQVESHQLLQPL